MPFSFWEYNHYEKQNSHIIVGGGIVGLSTAIEIKSLDKAHEVVVIDNFFPAQGASTKNAGFACFGSLSEILDDLTIMPENDVVEIIKMRWEGIKILRQRLQSQGIEILNNGGKELFNRAENISNDDVENANRIMKLAVDMDNYFVKSINTDFPHLHPECILMPHEGELNPMALTTVGKKLILKAISH
jgi:gamma-glutamylputrescine oxidase